MIPTQKLNQSEVELARRVARERHKSNRDSGVEDQKIGPQSDFKTDFMGMVAELAATKYLNVYPDLLIEPSAGGVDFVVEGAGTVDVKATTYADGMLLAPLWKSERDHADIYLLSIVSGRHVNFPGWAKSEDLFKKSNIKNLGYGDVYALSQSDLRHIDNIQHA